ncbi:MAG TPA: 30S ribosomal protein S18 [Dehalococcoidia bacterium]|nr:30S ribosomal protein S18 [Dehalococcoidia bacterium]
MVGEPERDVAEVAPPFGGEPARGEASQGEERPRRRGRGGRRRACLMCVEKMPRVDYKDVNLLRRFISERARIDTRRKTSCCAKHQRALARAIKRARHLALLPYTPGHIRIAGVGPSR